MQELSLKSGGGRIISVEYGILYAGALWEALIYLCSYKYIKLIKEVQKCRELIID